MIDGWCISCKNALRWLSLDLTDDKSTLVQVMAWCRQATSHYLSQCWPRSMSPHGITRPQWVNTLEMYRTVFYFSTGDYFYHQLPIKPLPVVGDFGNIMPIKVPKLAAHNIKSHSYNAAATLYPGHCTIVLLTQCAPMVPFYGVIELYPYWFT